MGNKYLRIPRMRVQETRILVRAKDIKMLSSRIRTFLYYLQSRTREKYSLYISVYIASLMPPCSLLTHHDAYECHVWENGRDVLKKNTVLSRSGRLRPDCAQPSRKEIRASDADALMRISEKSVQHSRRHDSIELETEALPTRNSSWTTAATRTGRKRRPDVDSSAWHASAPSWRPRRSRTTMNRRRRAPRRSSVEIVDKSAEISCMTLHRVFTREQLTVAITLSAGQAYM